MVVISYHQSYCVISVISIFLLLYHLSVVIKHTVREIKHHYPIQHSNVNLSNAGFINHTVPHCCLLQSLLLLCLSVIDPCICQCLSSTNSSPPIFCSQPPLRHWCTVCKQYCLCFSCKNHHWLFEFSMLVRQFVIAVSECKSSQGKPLLRVVMYALFQMYNNLTVWLQSHRSGTERLKKVINNP